MATGGQGTSMSEGEKRGLKQSDAALESILENITAFAKTKEDKLNELKKQCEDAKKEMREWQSKYAQHSLKIKTLNKENKRLRAKIATDGKDAADEIIEGLQSNGDIVTDAAAGDGPIRTTVQISIQDDQESIALSGSKSSVMELPATQHQYEKKEMREWQSKYTDAAAGYGPTRTPVQSIQDDQESVRFGAEHPESCPSSIVSSAGKSSVMELRATQHQPQGMAGNAAQGVAVSQAGSSVVNASGVITTDIISWLADNIGVREWKPLLRKLGMSDTIIEDIDHANQGNVHEQRYQGFNKWRMRKDGAKVTVTTLILAMKKESLNHLIREFCTEFNVDKEKIFANQKRLPLGCQSLPTGYSGKFHELIDQFLLEKEKYRSFLDELQGLNGLDDKQREDLNYPSSPKQRVPVLVPVLTVLDYRSEQILNTLPDEMGQLQEIWRVLRICGKEVRGVFKLYVRGGVVGPAEAESKKLNDLSFPISSKIEEMLSINQDGIGDWKALASWLKEQYRGPFERVDKYKIELWDKDKDPHKGASSVIRIWETTTDASVGKLYLWLVKNHRRDIAAVLE